MFCTVARTNPTHRAFTVVTADAFLAHLSTKCSRSTIVIGLSSVCPSVHNYKKKSSSKLTIIFQSNFTEMILNPLPNDRF